MKHTYKVRPQMKVLERIREAGLAANMKLGTTNQLPDLVMR
jgi:hypothetical protein